MVDVARVRLEALARRVVPQPQLAVERAREDELGVGREVHKRPGPGHGEAMNQGGCSRWQLTREGCRRLLSFSCTALRRIHEHSQG